MLKTRPNPVRFLLYTEWLMLMSCGSLAVMEMLEKGRLPIQHVLILALLGLMGWVLPSGKPFEKVIYMAIEVGLIFYGTLLGYLHILPSLYLIVVIRSCFIFDLPGRWAAAFLCTANLKKDVRLGLTCLLKRVIQTVKIFLSRLSWGNGSAVPSCWNSNLFIAAV